MQSEMELTKDIIVEISKVREKFFGCSGKMLLPCRATIEAAIREIPDGRLLTTDALRKELARRHDAAVTCPSQTKKVLKAIGQEGGGESALWHVVKKGGTLMADFPGGLDGHAARLTQAGFDVETQGKMRRVKNVQNFLFGF